MSASWIRCDYQTPRFEVEVEKGKKARFYVDGRRVSFTEYMRLRKVEEQRTGDEPV
jgi:hypothetical protein